MARTDALTGAVPPRVETSVRRGRFATNILANGGFFVFNIAIGIWLTPYLVHRLGPATYGLVPLATTITGYMAVLTLALNAAVARYMTIAIEQADHDTANQYFNTSLLGSIFLVLALLIPASLVILNVDTFIVVPAGQLAQVRWLFACTAGVFLLNTVKTPFEVSTYCLNRFDLRNLLAVAQKLTYVVFLVALFSLAAPQLRSVGLGLLAGACVSVVGAVGLWRILTPMLQVSYSWFDKKALKDLLSLGGWVSFDTVGAILYLGIDLLVVNWMFGPDSAGRYAAVLQWSVLLRLVAASVEGVFGPTILYYHARHDTEGLVRYVCRAIKCTGLMIALPVGLVCGLSAPLLETWLGPGFVELSWLMSLMTFHMCVNQAIRPLFGVQRAMNRVRIPAIATFITGLVNLGLALLLAGPAGWGMYGVAAAGAIALTARNVLFTPTYAARILGRKVGSFQRETLPIAIAALLITFACWLLQLVVDLTGWWRLGLVTCPIAALYAIAAYHFLLDAQDRDMLKAMIPRRRIPQ